MVIGLYTYLFKENWSIWGGRSIGVHGLNSLFWHEMFRYLNVNCDLDVIIIIIFI